MSKIYRFMTKEEDYVSRTCFADGRMISIPKRVFGSNGFIAQEHKGRVISDSIPEGVYVGECVFFCSSKCRDEYLGPKPKETDK
jgi:hypothetical protein